MKVRTVKLYIREQSTRKYKAVKKSHTDWTYPAGTVFVLRYGKTWETINAVSLTKARLMRGTRELELLQGWVPKPSLKREAQPDMLMLDRAIDTYLGEIEKGRKKKTFQAYSVALRYLYECIGNKPMSDITRSDLVKFTAFLRDEKEQAPRSAYNKFESVMIFLKHHGIDGKSLKIKSHDYPQYVEEEPEIYEQEMLDQLFAECDADERLLFETFLMSGCREQELIYMTDRCLDFSANTITVRHNPKFNWTPKMYKERTIPVPAALMAKLKKMLVDRGKGGLLFPTASGNPKFDFLDMAKAIARRAGIDESEVWLHKFRATFCTRSLWSGVDLRTCQAWMGHTDITSTMRYLKPQRGVKMQQMVEAIWA